MDGVSFGFCLLFSTLAPSLQISQILAHAEHADQDYWKFSGCPGQPDPGAGHYCLHLRRGGDAALWKELQRVCLQDQPEL